MSRTTAVTAGLALSFFGVGLGRAVAQPAPPSTPVTQCGQVLDHPGYYHLAEDLGPCTGDGVVITASRVRFTLAGHTLSGVSTQESCDLNQPQYGVSIAGDTVGVQVSGGTVRNFVDGIVQPGTRSRVTAMTVADNCLWGIAVQGSENHVDTSRVSGSDDGIQLCEAQDAVIDANEVFGNLRYGVSLSCNGTDRNRVTHNILHENGGVEGGGIAVFSGDDARILGNAVRGNWEGIVLSATTGTLVRDNTVTGNRSVGIAAGGAATGNTLRQNTAYGNALFDLSDNNPAANSWINNRYLTSDF